MYQCVCVCACYTVPVYNCVFWRMNGSFRSGLLAAVVLAMSAPGLLAGRVERANLHPPNDRTGVLLKPAKMPDPTYHPAELEEWLEDCDFIDSRTLNKPAVPVSMQTKAYRKLDDTTIARFRQRGFVALRKVVSARELRHRVQLHNDGPNGKGRTLPLSKALPACCKDGFESFFRLHNLWRTSRFIRQLVLAPRFARIAADLMGVTAVKLYQDSLFVKQPGHNRSSWHQDHVAAPFVADKPSGMKMVTMWLPLQKSTSDDMGALRFAAKSHQDRRIFSPDVEDIHTAGTLSDTHVRSLFSIEDAADYMPNQRLQLGDATFHDGFTLHGSGPNMSPTTRWALAVQFVEADISAMTPVAFAQQQEDPENLMPIGPRVGDDLYSFSEWLRASAVFADITSNFHLTPVEHPLLPLAWSRDLDARSQYFKAQGEYEEFQIGTWRSTDSKIRPCPLDEQDWRNEYGDGCEPYRKGNPAHTYCISDGQEAYMHCPSSCETMCTSSSFHKQVLEGISEL